jgi:hypothetical protein
VFWAGDSRAYVFESTGARQLSTDDLRDPGDALANLRRDSVVSNAMSADVEFHVNYRRVQLRAPFLVICATDGCFGYVPTPMHFEHLVLSRLVSARNTEAWSSSLQTEIAAVTGDDAAMSSLGVGADFKEFQKLFAPRVAQLASDVVEPLDQLSVTVARLEQELHELRLRQLDETTEKWNQYKAGYERYLRPEPLTEEEEFVGEDVEPVDVIDAEGPADTVETREPALDDDEVEGAESAPAEAPAQMDDSSAQSKGESSS